MATNQGNNDKDQGNNNEDKDDSSNRGFASMDPEKQREIASQGGKAAHEKGSAHEFTSEEAREAGSHSHDNDNDNKHEASSSSLSHGGRSASRSNGQGEGRSQNTSNKPGRNDRSK